MEDKRRITIISICCIVLVAMMVAVTIELVQFPSHSNSTNYDHKEVSTSMNAVKSLCEPTDYQKVCIESLSSSAGNTTDPTELIKAAIEVAMKQVQEAANNSTLLEELQNDPRTKEALGNCHHLAESAANDLRRCFDQMGKIDDSKLDDFLNNFKIWLSGAITYQETCLDGFENTTGDAGEKMKEYLKIAMELTSNGLAMVTQISDTISSLHIQGYNRRLLSDELPISGNDEFPLWVNAENKRFLIATPKNLKPDLIVAQDGTGNYRTINEALKDIPKNSNKTFVFYIKAGVYEEKVQFNRSLTNLMVIGDGPTKTRITGRLNYIDGTSTFQTATVVALGDNFIAKDIGFENSAGPEKHQAVALRVGADKSIFYNCHMDGYQDTLYAHTYRQFYRNCVISGTIDFIFGDSAAVFQNCTMLVRKPLDNQANIVTAQGRKDHRQPTGIVLQNCTITSDPAYHPVRSVIKTYLGRPWKEFSRTIIMESYIDDLIQPEGWMPWNETFGINTCSYTEYNNRGPAASKLRRVKWKGVKEVTKTRIEHFTASQFIMGNTWIPETGVPYTPGLIFPPPPDSPNALDLEEDESQSLALPPTPQVASPAPSPAFAPASQQTGINLPTKRSGLFSMFF